VKTKNCQILTSAGLLSYVFVRSPRRKTIAIQIDQDLTVRVFAPNFSREEDVANFIKEKAFWIHQKIQSFRKRHFRSTKRTFKDGDKFLFLGKEYNLFSFKGQNKRVKIKIFENNIYVYLSDKEIKEKDKDVIAKSLEKWYQKEAREILAGRIFHFARILDVDPSKVTIRTQKKIWGSCHHSTKRINLNWKIIMAPLNVADYVIVHELCHLKTPNHSKKFWSRVQKVLPEYKECEQWLHAHSGLMTLS